MPRKKKEIVESVILTEEEITQVTTLIKSGKTLQQIGEALAPRPKLKEQKPIYLPLPKVEITETPMVEVKIDYLVDNKRISLGASRPLAKNMDLQDAHEQLYGEILASMANLLELNKETK